MSCRTFGWLVALGFVVDHAVAQPDVALRVAAGEKGPLHERLEAHLRECYRLHGELLASRFGLAASMAPPFEVRATTSIVEMNRLCGRSREPRPYADGITVSDQTLLLLPEWNTRVAGEIGLPVALSHVAAHEAFHQVAFRAGLNGVIPDWYEEALAEWAADRALEAEGLPRLVEIRHLQRLRLGAEFDSLPRTAHFFESSALSWDDEGEGITFYEMGWLLLTVLNETHGDALRVVETALGRAIREKAPLGAAEIRSRLSGIVGSVEALDAAIRAFVLRHPLAGWVLERGDVRKTDHGWQLIACPPSKAGARLLLLERFERMPFHLDIRVGIPEHLGAGGAAGILIAFDRMNALRQLVLHGDDATIDYVTMPERRRLGGDLTTADGEPAPCFGATMLHLDVGSDGVNVSREGGPRIRLHHPRADAPCLVWFTHDVGAVTYEVLEEKR